MNNFKYFDDIIAAVEALSGDEIENGLLVELSYQSAVSAKDWGIPVDQMRPELIKAAKRSGLDHNDAAYDVNDGLADGLNALGAFCRLRDSHSMKQQEK